MATTNNSAASNIPVFGCAGTVSVATEAKKWILTNITVTPASDVAELRDAAGLVVSRTHYNLSSTGVNKSSTIQIQAIPAADTLANAKTAAEIIANGTIFAVGSSDVTSANGNWECTGMTLNLVNTDHASITLNGVWSAVYT